MTKAPDEFRSLARSHSRAALETLVAVMNHADATTAARFSAANAIIERAWGKPTQSPESADNDEQKLNDLSTNELLAQAAPFAGSRSSNAPGELAGLASAYSAGAAGGFGETVAPRPSTVLLLCGGRRCSLIPASGLMCSWSFASALMA